jgi:hypothetical protein
MTEPDSAAKRNRASRRAAVMCLWLAVICSGMPSSAFASPLRKLASSTAAFLSDGSRYVAWQSARSGVVVLDTRSGHRGEITLPAGCKLAGGMGPGEWAPEGEPRTIAAGGRFMVNCTVTFGLLDVRTGAVTMLPKGSEWRIVGKGYVQGRAVEGKCLSCTALYDIATGVVSARPPEQALDLDQRGAPPICRALRRHVFNEREAGLPRFWSYSSGVFAHQAARRGEPTAGGVRIERCHGHPTVVHTRREAFNFDVGDGLVTWDNGRKADFAYDENEDTEHGTLTAYWLANGRRRTWSLPSVSLAGGEYVHQSGVFGYSVHTANTVFWIATRALNGDRLVERSSVYAASLR